MSRCGGYNCPGCPVCCWTDTDPLGDPIPEDTTRWGTTALTLHEMARAEHKARRGTTYRVPLHRRIWRAITRWAR